MYLANQDFVLRQNPSKNYAVHSMDGPVLVFGGCYGNFEATEAVLRAADSLQIPPARMICTGDLVAYCADARATVDLIRKIGVHVVMGNCEESLGSHADDCGCGFTKGSSCDQLSTAWYAHADAEINEDTRAWMGSLPRRLDIMIGQRRLAIIHGGVERINEFIFASSSAELFRNQLDKSGCDGVIGGHCGIPFTRIVDGRIWHNSGAIGMPANDGTSRTWFSVIIPASNGIKVRHIALTYDHENAVKKIRAAGLPEGYASALQSGLWPSCDVLPANELKLRGEAIKPREVMWRDKRHNEDLGVTSVREARVAKFSNPNFTASGEKRAKVSLVALKTLWFNTGTLCNIACKNCYIESNPRNDRIAYLTREEARTFLAEAKLNHAELEEIGFTGGEPFMNPDILGMIEDSLAQGWKVLVLTNAMKPMQHSKSKLLDIHRRFPGRFKIRVSIDHYASNVHEEIRGLRSWRPVIEGLLWLVENGFDIAIAGRNIRNEADKAIRTGYQRLFESLGISINAADSAQLVIFPEMDGRTDIPEITEQCWRILNKQPDTVMCASSRMVIKRKGAERPAVVSCTLLPYELAFELGSTLAESCGSVKLNHPHCAKFCVLGGASCSPRVN